MKPLHGPEDSTSWTPKARYHSTPFTGPSQTTRDELREHGPSQNLALWIQGCRNASSAVIRLYKSRSKSLLKKWIAAGDTWRNSGPAKGIVSPMMAVLTDVGVRSSSGSRQNGNSPTSSRYSIMPSDHISLSTPATHHEFLCQM